jgi:PKD repeat protein
MKKITLVFSCILSLTLSAQKQPIGNGNAKPAAEDDKVVVIPCTEFHITKPLSELVKENPVDENKVYEEEESEDREHRKPQKFVFSEKDGPQYGNDPSSMQREMGSVAGKAPIQNWAGQTASGFRPFDPSGAAGPTHYVQMINSTTFRVYNKSTGATMLTATLGNLWSPATANDGDPIVMYDKAADRWFLAQFGSANNMYIAISTTNNPTGSYYTYTFTSPDFPDYLKFSTWQDGYYMTGNYAQKVFCFERTAMLAGTPTARSIYKTFSPPNAGYFFVPLPGDVSDGALPASGTPCPIFSYSDNGWGAGYSDAINIYKMAVTWGTTPAATITSAGTVPTAAFDASYDAGWNDVSQPGTTQKLDGIGGVLMYRAQYKIWSGYNSVVLNWAVKISATQRSIKWCELRQNSTTGVWSMYQEGIYTPDANTRWLGSIAMDANGAIGLAYLKANSTSIYPGLYYTGRRSCDPLGTLPVTETVAQAGTGSQTGANRDGDYAHMSLDPDGVTFWYTGEYMGGTTGAGAARTRIFSFQLPTCGAAAPVADFVADNTTPCIGATVNFTDLSTNTPTSWAWSFSPTSITYTGGTTAASQNPKVQFSTAGPYTVTLVATNASGSNTMVKTAYINPVTAGTLPLVENFEGATFPPTGWTVLNADAPSIAWGTAGAKGLERRAAAGNTGSTSGSAGIELYNYNTDTTQVDELISKPVSLVGATAPRMTFKRAYKYYNDATNPNNYHDELRIFISTDCGATYGSAVYYKKGVQLATNGTLNTSFTPAATADWDIDTVDLTSYIGQNIYVKFQVTNRYGNNLYLDDVNINNTAGSVASVSITSNDADNVICAGTSVTFTAIPTNGGTAPIYQWQVNGANVGTNSPTYTTSTLTSGQVVTCIMTSNLPGVTGSPATSNAITMTVNAVPSAPTAGSNSPVCAGATINLTATTVAGATYAWSGPSAYTAGVQNPSRTGATAAMAGTYSVTATVSGCTSPAATTVVVVNALPSAPTAGSNSPVCAGSTINLTATTVAGATYSWTGPSTFSSSTQNPSRPSATAAMAGTYSVTATAGGCTSPVATTVVVVNAIPAAPTAGSNSPVCAGAPINLTATTVAGATYAWSGPSAYTAGTQNPTRPGATAAMAGTYSVTATVAGCSSPAATTTVVVNPLPASPTAGSNSPVCAGSTINLTATTVAGATYAWSGPSSYTSATQNPSRTGATAAMAGTYSVTATVGGCTSPASTTTVVVNPVPTMTAPANITVCNGATVPASAYVSSPSGGTFSWTNSLTSIGLAASGSGNTPAFTAVNTGTSPVTAVITVTATVSGCTSNPVTYTITVNPIPLSTYTQSANQCLVGNSFNFLNTGSTGTYSWTFAGGTPATSTVNNPSGVTFTTAGTHAIAHTVTSAGCSSTSNTTVTVFANPTAQATSTTSTACGASTGTITIGATTGGTGPYTYSVNGSGFTATTSYTGFGAGSYPVIVQDVNGCQFSTTAVISNSTGPTAQAASVVNSTCGASNGVINLGTTTGGTGPYTFSVNGSAFTTTTTYSGLAAGSYTVIVKDAGGCMYTTTVTVGNNAGPTAIVTTTGNSNCGGNDGTITLGTVTGGTGPFTYSVDGSASTTTTSYTGFAAGTYPVIVTDANGCTFSTTATVSNTGTTPATPVITQSGSTLTSSSATGNQWYLDGNPIPGATGQTYTFTSNGTYTVIVTTGGCSSASSAPEVITNVGIGEAEYNPYGLLIYPNPNDGHFIVSFVSASYDNYKVEIVNALGQLIFRDDLKDFSGTYKKEMTVVEYGQGIYTISLTNSKNETVKKIVVY